MALCLLLLAGCIAKRERYDVPLLSMPERYANAPLVGEANTFMRDSASSQQTRSLALSRVLAKWWRLLNNPELDGLMDRVLANNLDLRIAALRIAQTEARLKVTAAPQLPEISVPAQAKFEAPEDGVGTIGPGGKVRSRSTYQISLRGDWRPDIWGEYASMVESAEFQLLRATFQRDDVQRTVVANVAAAYLEYLSLNDRLRVARETDKVLSEMLISVADRLEGGDATITEMEQQKAAVYAVRATIPVLEQQREVVTNRMAILAGTVPGDLKLSENGLDTVTFPTVIPGVPSSFLLHRPDVRVVEARLLAADADIDVARARVLPPLDLTAQIGYGSRYFSQVFQPYSLAWNFIANLSATIFDNGKRAGEVDFARAVHEEMVETYVRVIHDALREIEDALSAIRLMGNRLEAQQIATDSSRRAWYFSQESYVAGAEDYLVVLDTERTYHRNLDDWYTVRMERYRGLINLFSALGGGVPREGGAMPGDGDRPTPLRAEFDVSLTADLDYHGVQKAGAKPGLPSSSQGGTERLLARNVELLHSTTPASLERVAGVEWSAEGLDDKEEYWLVEMAGLYDRPAVNAAWRDLRTRFPALTENRTVFPRQQGRVEGTREERASWYRLFIAKFPEQAQAEEFCATLRSGQLRCQAISSLSLPPQRP